MSSMVNRTLEDLKLEFNILENPMDKYQYIIDIGKEKSENNHNIRTNENLIKGCVSQAWMHFESKNHPIKIVTDSDALIVKGLLGILERIINNSTLEEIKDIDGSKILNEIGLGYSISSQRTNGFIGAINKIKLEL